VFARLGASGARIPLDARPFRLAVPDVDGRLEDLPDAHRVVRSRYVYRPHAQRCPDARGRTARVAGDDS
jgi:hypothetical protein